MTGFNPRHVWMTSMIRALIEEGAAIVALALFIACIAIWAMIIVGG